MNSGVKHRDASYGQCGNAVPKKFRCANCGEYQGEAKGSCMTVEPDAGNPHGNMVLGEHEWVRAVPPSL